MTEKEKMIILEKAKLLRLEKEAEAFLKKLRKNYPEHAQGDAEFTRVEEALEHFLKWGYWAKHVDDYYNDKES